MASQLVTFAIILLSAAVGLVSGFQLLPTDKSLYTTVSRHHHNILRQHTRGRRALFNAANEASTEAERLLSKAKAIREELEGDSTRDSKQIMEGKSPIQIQSEFCLPATTTSSASNNNYRLYLDVGSEPGTWMDPRWGVSGRRRECTIDVSFSPADDATEESSE